MSSPFIGEIRLVGFSFAPVGWAFCDGSTQPIDQNSALYTLIGTTYGGDGVQTFNLPNLRSRVPIHVGNDGAGNTYALGQMSGSESVTLTTNQIPNHTHPLSASNAAATTADPTNSVLAQPATAFPYFSGTPGAALNGNAVGIAGGNLSHENMTPFLAINFIIALFGIFPSQN